MAEKYFDVLIIGGGVMGASIAYHLLNDGFTGRVGIVEKDSSYEFASTPRSVGGIRQQFSTEVNIRVCLYSVAAFERFDEEMAVDGEPARCDYRANGYLILGGENNWQILWMELYSVSAPHCLNNLRKLPDHRVRSIALGIPSACCVDRIQANLRQRTTSPAAYGWERSVDMLKQFAVIIIGIIVIICNPANAAQTPQDILNAVIRVTATIPQGAATARILGTEREGNGVVIDEKGHILTIGYLILEAETIEVHTDQGDLFDARFVAYDYQTGFGIVRTDPPLPVRPVKLGDSSRLKVGDPILMVGFGGAEAVIGSRVVSRDEFTGYWEYLLETAIYTSPPHTNYGGAALFNSQGQLLGIGSIFTRLNIQGLGILPCNMSVPIDLLKPILPDLISTGRSASPPQPWLGIHADEVHGRVFIIRVTPGGPAEKAGLKKGDIILAVDQSPVKGLADLFRQVWKRGPAGIKVPLEILQDTQVRRINVESADRYQYLRVSRQK